MYEPRFPAPIPRELGRGQFKSTDPWSIIFTSGTTGLPKACGLTHWSTMKMNTTKLMLGMKPGDVAYSALPLYHAYASQLGMASVGACLKIKIMFFEALEKESLAAFTRVALSPFQKSSPPPITGAKCTNATRNIFTTSAK